MKLNKYSWLAVLPMIFTACQEDTLVNDQQNDKVYTLSARLDEASAMSRAQIQLGNTDASAGEIFFWNEGDKITLYQEVDGNHNEHVYTISNYSEDGAGDKKVASFMTYNPATASSVTAFYPSGLATDFDGESKRVTLSLQTSVDFSTGSVEEVWKNYFRNNMLMRAITTLSADGENTLNFEHLLSLARITYHNVSGIDQQVTEIKLGGDQHYGYAPTVWLDYGWIGGMFNNGYGITYNNLTVRAGESFDFYILFAPDKFVDGDMHIHIHTAQTDGNRSPLVLPTSTIAAANNGAEGFEAGKRYWFKVTEKPEGLVWTNNNQSQEAKIQLAAKNGGEFTVTERIRLTAPLIVEKDLILNFNGGASFDGDIGQFVDSESLKAMVVVKPGASLTINGNGEINTGHMDTQLSCIRMIGGSNETSKVVINNGSLIGTHHVILIDEDCQNAQVEINGGSLSSDWSIVSNDYNGSAILNKSDAQVTINGGHISSSASAVEMWGGQFTMTNGTLEASYQGENSHVDTNGVADNCIIGSALAIYPSAGNSVTAFISNGTFQGMSSIYEICSSGTPDVSLSVTGGTFEGGINSYNCTGFISGGRFKVQSDTRYIVDGKSAVLNGSYYEIQDGAGEGETTNAEGLAAVISKVYPDLVTKNADGTYTINQEKAAEVVELALSEQGTIESLDGIENFPNLERLFCNNVGLKTLDISNNQNLKQIEVVGNDLISLNFSSNPALEIIQCHHQNNNSLRSLDVTGNINLKTLGCQNNTLTSLDLTKNVNLEWLDCGVNELSSLNLENNLKLRELLLACNDLTSLDISKHQNLTYLHCTENHITTLDITKNTNLQTLNCGNQQPDGTFITVKMTEAQKELWDANWSNIEYWNSRYVNVVVVEADSNLVTIQNAELSTALQAVLGAENVKLENGYAVMTKAFAESVETLNFTSKYTITSLNGIENFTGLRVLTCARTGLTECDLSKNTKLESVAVWGNSLTTLDLSNQPSLYDINCAQNNTLQTLKINENAKLKYLIIDDTNLQSLVIPNPETIWQLAYSRTPLNLNLTQFTGMEILFCSGNKLTTINLTAAQKLRLTNLECDSNSLTSLNLSEYPNLRELSCWRNLIETLDITPLKNLQSLSCGNQQNGIVLQLKLTDDQKTQWESKWENENLNTKVELLTGPSVEPGNGNTGGSDFTIEGIY